MGWAAREGAGDASAVAWKSGACFHVNMSPKNSPAELPSAKLVALGPGEVRCALDRCARALDPARIELVAQADNAVALVGDDVALVDQAGDRTWTAREAIRSRVLAPYSFMCGATECAFRSSAVSHLSITTKVSGPNLAVPMPSTSMVGPYSTQPFSARTAARLAWAGRSSSSRLPGLGGISAETWVMVSSLAWFGRAAVAPQAAGPLVVGGKSVLAVAANHRSVHDHG